jgi:hypothetical protein
MAIGRIPEPGTGIPESIVDAKGDIITATGSDAPARLAVGANGTTLVADSSTATGLVWKVDPVADLVTTAGDTLYATAADTLVRLGIGTAGQVLQVNSGATAPEWATPAAGGGMTSIATGSLSSTSVTISSISGAYKHLYLVIFDAQVNTATGIAFRINGSTSTYWRLGADLDTSGWNAASDNKFRPYGSNLPTSGSQWQNTLLIENYADSSSLKPYSGREMTNNASAGTVFFAGNSSITAAITSITVLTVNGTSTFTGGTYILYGVN